MDQIHEDVVKNSLVDACLPTLHQENSSTLIQQLLLTSVIWLRVWGPSGKVEARVDS